LAPYFGDYESGMTLLLSGATLTGMRARDISRGIDLLASRSEVDPARIYGAGVEAGGVSLLHAASLDPRIRKLALERTLVSYQAVVDHKIHRNIFEHVVPGVLKTYDLPDLARIMAPRQVRIIDAVNPVGQALPLEEVRKQYDSAIRRRAADSAASLYGFGD
jgi:hypothetical protein